MKGLANKVFTLMIVLLATAQAARVSAQEVDSVGADSVLREGVMKQLVVRANTGSRLNRVTNTELIGQAQLVRAACCNLGESFTTNPSVDVSYSDAATGAKQIKLLGLSGTYVQMLTENVPNLRGAAIPYCLGYVPGPWMQSIQVSKGASSVKNGYESITGQINIEYLKPQNPDGVRGNVYYDTDMKLEANADGNLHLTDRLSTALLLHYEDRQREHDMNKDGFADMPRLRQFNIMNRWAYVAPRFISQLFARVLKDERASGQTEKAAAESGRLPRYEVGVDAERYELQWKNAIITDPQRNASVALMLHGSLHKQENQFGLYRYDIKQRKGLAQLMYESDLTERHNLSVGASLNHDYFRNSRTLLPADLRTTLRSRDDRETTGGLYAQYTYKLDERLTVMAGLRWDRSSLYGGFWTPRLHARFSPTEWLTVRASAGKGYRTPHALAENIPLFALSGRCVIEPELDQEEAWNYGASLGLNIPVGGKKLEVNVEYYYTDFLRQMVIWHKRLTDPAAVSAGYEKALCIGNLDGRSYSHTVQVDATYPLFAGCSATAAWRFNDAQTTYDGQLRWRPLTPRHKGLLTLTYKTPLELWQFDVTGQLIGHGQTYDGERYPSYGQLQAQVTREFRHFSVYLGGENLTGYKMKEPILGAANPWGPAFDATQVWGPTSGAMAYIGLRIKFEK